MNKDMYLKLKETLKNSYAPYSHFHTAAIVETDKGLFEGVNVENAAYGLTNCAERSAIFNAVSNGAKKFKVIYLISSSHRNDITPCGACRQVMAELFTPTTPIIVYNIDGKVKKYTHSQLLPCDFTKSNLNKK
jgi:cytidine deaminase